ncbi:DUF1667 domain-containing protein [Anaerorhabdus sp.]|jgi:CxxC motif-containing protein|uniref:DUF1667 domain-containing protein n=1 Tax=Anaerorhabdus sp. TaxID=1872524 RepID=UPI002FC6ECCA
MKQEMICITCPMGCHLTVELVDNDVKSVSGNTCPRGKDYAINECLHPLRVLTSTVIIKNALVSRCPVITSKPIPKEKIFDAMKEINEITIQAPIHINDVIIKNVCGLDVDVIASRSMGRV